MTTISSTLRINLIEDATKNGPRVAAALEKVQREAEALQAALGRSGLSDRMQGELAKLGASAGHVDELGRAWQHYATERGIAGKVDADLTKAEVAGLKTWERQALASERVVMTAEVAIAKQRQKAEEAAEHEAVQVASRRIAEEKRLAEQAARDSRRLAEQQSRDQAFFAQQAVRDAQRAEAERVSLMERETREARRQAEIRVNVAHREAEQRREAIARGGFGHFVATGAAAAVSAHAVVRGAETSIEQGAELQHVRIGMEQAGIDAATRQAIEDQALQLSARYGNVSQVAIMDLAKEARSVLKDTKEVAPTTTVLAQAKSVLDASDRTGGSSEGLGKLVKGAESIGAAQDPERLAKLIDGYVKAIQVMGKTINPDQIYEFDKYLKAEGARVSDRFLMTTGLSLAQEMGGSTAGKDIAQTAKDIIGGFQNKHVPLKEMARVGMIDRGDIEWVGGRNGKREAKGIKAGHKGIHGADVAATDLDVWVYKYFLPQLEKKGITEESKQLDFVSKVFTGTEGDVISKLITQRTSFENHALLYGQAKGLAGSDLNHQLATAGLDAFTKALGNLEANATSPAMGIAGRALFSIADGLNYLAIKAKDHPAMAVTAAGIATAGGLGASGYLAYKMLNGFGLGTSATALTGSATALDTAAAALGEAATVMNGKGVAEVARKAMPAAVEGVEAGVAAGHGGSAFSGTNTIMIASATILATSLINNMPEVQRDKDGKPYIVPPLNTSKFDTWWKGTMPTWFGGAAPQDGSPPIAGKRASGGPVSRGKTYLVGEHGPELFTPGMNGAISTADVQRLLSRASFTGRASTGDPGTADAVRSMAFALAGAVDGIARAIDRLDRDNHARAAIAGEHDVSGSGTGSHISGGRRGYMARGGHFGGRRGFLTRQFGTKDESLPDSADTGPHVRLGKTSGGGGGRMAKFDAKAPAILGGLMTKYGLTKEQAAGIVGNLGHESARFTAYHEGGKASAEGGVGWAQWTGTRRRAFERWVGNHAGADGKPLDPTSDEASWRYLTEGDPETGKAVAAVKRTHTAADATRAFHDSFERSADIDRSGRIAKPKNWQDRVDLANRALAMDAVPGERAPDVVASGRSSATDGAPGGARPAALVDDGGRRAAMAPGQSAGHLRGKLALDGHAFDFGTGGNRGASSIPFGDYEITPDAVGAWGKAHGALGIANGQIWDKTLGRMRTGIELHAAHSANMISSGCLAFAKDQFGEVKAHVLKMVRDKGHAYLHVGNGGASITSDRAAPKDDPAGTPAEGPRGEPLVSQRDDPLGLRRQRDGGVGDLHAGLGALHGKTITPAVDNQHLEKTAALLDHIHGRMGAIGQVSARARQNGGGASPTRVAGLGSRTRGNFSSGGLSIG